MRGWQCGEVLAALLPLTFGGFCLIDGTARQQAPWRALRHPFRLGRPGGAQDITPRYANPQGASVAKRSCHQARMRDWRDFA